MAQPRLALAQNPDRHDFGIPVLFMRARRKHFVDYHKVLCEKINMRTNILKQRSTIRRLAILPALVLMIPLMIRCSSSQHDETWVRLYAIKVQRQSLADSLQAFLVKGAGFQELARSYSSHSSAAQGGLLGWVKLSALHGEVRQALVHLGKLGTTSVIPQEDSYFIYLKEVGAPEQDTPHWHKIKNRVEALMSKIDSLLTNVGDYAQAMAVIAEAEKRAAALHEFESTAALLYHKGNVMLRRGNYPDAVAKFSELIDFASAFGMNEWWGKGVGRLGNVFFSAGRGAEAIPYLETAVNIARASGDQRGEANWLGSLGLAYHSLQQHDRAQEYLTQALAKARAAKDTWGEGQWWSSLALGYQYRGELSKAAACFDSALTLARQNQNKRALALAFGNLGQTYLATGEFMQAASALDSALSLVHALGDQQSESDYLSNLGNLHANLGHYDKAIAYYERAVQLSQQLGNSAKTGDSQGELGKVYVAQGDYPRAIQNFERALTITHDLAHRQNELHWMEQLGAVFQTMGDYEKAVSYFTSGLQLARQIGNPSQKIIMLCRLGDCSSAKGKHDQAIDFYQRGADLARANNDKPSEMFVLSKIGNTHSMLGDVPKAMPYLENARKLAREIGNPAMQMRMTISLAQAFSDLGRYEKAITMTVEAITYAQASNNKIDEASLLSNQGVYYMQLGDYSRAISAYGSALEIYRKIARRDDQALCLRGLGVAYGLLGQWQLSRAFYDSALAIFQAIGDKFNAAVCLGNVASVSMSLGHYQDAVSRLDQAILILNQMGDPRIVPSLLNTMADAYALQGNVDQAINLLDQAIAKARELGNQEYEVMNMSELGVLLSVQGKLDSARYYATSALALAEKINDRESVWKLHRSLAKTNLAMRPRDPESALQHFEAAMMIIESLGEEIRQDPLKLPFLEDRQGLYREYVEALLSRKEKRSQEHALEIAERARARAFAELIARRFHGQMADQEKSLLAPASFQQIQQTAQRLQASILEYFVTENNLVIWLITPNGQSHTVAVPIQPAAFDSLLNICYLGFNQMPGDNRAIRAPDFVGRNVIVVGASAKINFAAYFTKLYQILFPKKIQTHLPQGKNAKLLLVPDRKLSIIPIMALQDSSKHCLLEKYSAHQVPGIGVLLRTHEILKARKRTKKMEQDDILVFGNPEMPQWGNSILRRLDGAEEEVRAIANSLQTDFQIGTAASETAFKSSSLNKRLIHLATHGVSFDASPLESFVALAPGNGEDGQLTAAEILEMQFNADLVVLSACETGLGKISGDGVEGLLRSFMVSGVPSVLVSLWKVDDDATRKLMLAFYENLNKGMDKAEALRQAQLKMMGIPKWRDPRYWAAFVLYGER